MKYGGGQICVQWNLGHVGTRHFVSTLGPGILSAHWDQAFCQHIGTRHFVSTLGPGILSAHWDQAFCQHIGTRHFVREVALSLEVKNVLV